MIRNQQVLFPPKKASKETRRQSRPQAATKAGKTTSGKSRSGNASLRITPLYLLLLKEMQAAGYMRTDQIGQALRLLADREQMPIADRALPRVVQRKLKQLVEAGVVRRFKPPIVPGERKGPPHYIYAVAKAGLALLSDELGIARQEFHRRSAGEDNLLFLDHALAVVDYRLALTRSCVAHGVTLVQWQDDLLLRKEPARVNLTSEEGEQLVVRVVPDASYQIRLPNGHALTCCLEMDRGTTTVAPSKWQARSWRRKVLAYHQLLVQRSTEPSWTAGPFIVTTVTTSQSRLAHLKATCEDVGGDHRFWFTTLDDSRGETVLGAPVWYVAGKGDRAHSLLPQR